MVAEVKAQGWPVSIHCNGDLTLDIALDAIEAAYGAYPSTGVNRIEHCTDHQARADRAHGAAWRAAELSHEPRLFLWGRLSR